MRIFTVKGIVFRDYCISWVLIAGLLIGSVGLVYANAYIPKNTGDDILTDSFVDSKSEMETTTPDSSVPNNNQAPEKSAGNKNNRSKTATDNTNTTVNTGDNSPTTNTNGESSSVEETLPTTTYHLVAIGDSITNASNPQLNMIGNNPSYSFSTGTNINSFYKYLLARQSLTPINLAVSGAKTSDCLSSQVPRIIDYNPKYITILIGGNDLLSYLSETPVLPADFESNINSIIAGAVGTGRTVLVGNIPNYSTIWQADYSACNPYKSLDSSLVAIGINYFNGKISTATNNNGAMLVDLFNSDLGTGDVSEVDCIHPNLSGQQKIADRFIDRL
jgi:lysophospholipase L1-like esterase